MFSLILFILILILKLIQTTKETFSNVEITVEWIEPTRMELNNGTVFNISNDDILNLRYDLKIVQKRNGVIINTYSGRPNESNHGVSLHKIKEIIGNSTYFTLPNEVNTNDTFDVYVYSYFFNDNENYSVSDEVMVSFDYKTLWITHSDIKKMVHSLTLIKSINYNGSADINSILNFLETQDEVNIQYVSQIRVTSFLVQKLHIYSGILDINNVQDFNFSGTKVFLQIPESELYTWNDYGWYNTRYNK